MLKKRHLLPLSIMLLALFKVNQRVMALQIATMPPKETIQMMNRLITPIWIASVGRRITLGNAHMSTQQFILLLGLQMQTSKHDLTVHFLQCFSKHSIMLARRFLRIPMVAISSSNREAAIIICMHPFLWRLLTMSFAIAG